MRKNRDAEYASIVPHARQLTHQKMEFYGFFHFTINTFTDTEWGDGTESPQLFHPEKLDANQWVHAIKTAGMTGAILTCKHHDGFCLWPSSYTTHTVAASPYKNGAGDIVREVSDALHREGLAFGIYLSPWDRNHPSYGQGAAYDDYFVNQLTELLTGYGPVFCVWLDGACGENQEGKRQQYDWERYYAVIRKLQPQACISVCGPDVRWCGNEAGKTRESEWSVVPKALCDAEKVAEKSQQKDEVSFRMQNIKSDELDLGSRVRLQAETELIWYPSEVNTSIRPGWFYHESEDEQVKTLKELAAVYERSVGGNATFLLNIPPTKAGLLHQNDVRRLKELGDYIKSTYAENLLLMGKLHTDGQSASMDPTRRDEYDCLYSTKEGETELTLLVRFPQKVKISRIVLMENIVYSQRIEQFELWAETDGRQALINRGTTVGYKKIVSFPAIEAKELVLKITDARDCIHLFFLGIYT
ncbi:MAG: alpha-L-fucosidase [Lachnospiraceae bacterium]